MKHGAACIHDNRLCYILNYLGSYVLVYEPTLALETWAQIKEITILDWFSAAEA